MLGGKSLEDILRPLWRHGRNFVNSNSSSGVVLFHLVNIGTSAGGTISSRAFGRKEKEDIL